MKKLSLAIFALALGATSAMAGTVTYNATTFSGPTDLVSQLLALPQWNPALFVGQSLQSAQITLSLSENPGNFTITNTAAPAEVFTFSFNSTILTSGGEVAADVPTLAGMTLFSATLHLHGNGGTLCTGPADPGSGTPCSSFQDNPGSTNSSGTGVLDSNLANLVLYTGIGTFNIQYDTLTGSSFVGGGGNLSLAISNIATADASITYTYGPSGAPEPATLTLMGSALLGLGLIGRKRFSR